MASQITDLDRIRAQGREWKAAGRIRRVRMGLLAVAYLEDRYDGLDGYIKALAQKGWGAGKVRACIAGMIAGLLHEKPKDQTLEDFEAEVEEALDGTVDGLMAVIILVAGALDDSWPKNEDAGGPKAVGRPRSISPGPSSITSRPSRSRAQTRRSGR